MSRVEWGLATERVQCSGFRFKSGSNTAVGNTLASYQQEEHQHIDGAGTAAAVSVLKSDEGRGVEGQGKCVE